MRALDPPLLRRRLTVDQCLAWLDLIDAPEQPTLRSLYPGLALNNRGPHLMQRAVGKALLPCRALIDYGVRRIARQRECGNCLAQRIELFNSTDERPGALIHLL